ncbi:TIGR02302 family protein [Jiella avicenniae]|uniref:TIGR02302 family protein n=1 Tax=Jiella avicenniae TaxID=2907202 RepID=A0A9X1T4F0_9HYPH|nr:TIGR02302 family protein [Jiella avicenniae]MCE7027867.1 TIGR02302 family protein [Jiella avicenniae]
MPLTSQRLHSPVKRLHFASNPVRVGIDERELGQGMADNDASRTWRPTRRLGWTRRTTFAAMLLERSWPAILGLAASAALFLVFAWFGLFRLMPDVLRIVVLAVIALCALASIALLAVGSRRLRFPSTGDVDRRIEATSRLTHQPLRAQGERPSSDDPFAAALWREHQRRMSANLRHLTGGAPATRSERLDPIGLRAVLALLLVTSFAFSFGPDGGRIADAFLRPASVEAAGRRVDAWVTPPAYTRRAPIFLTAADTQPITVPEGSKFSLRVSNGESVDVTFDPAREGADAVAILSTAEAKAAEAAAGDGAAPATGDANETAADETKPAAETGGGAETAAPADGPRDYEYTVAESGSIDVETGFSSLGQWRFSVTPDADPTIAFKDEPSESRNGALQLAYEVGDDYGVRKARGEIEVEGAQAAGARPLYPAPEMRLAVPRRGQGVSEGKSSVDLTESPYAGAKVDLTLVAEDDAGQTGRSKTKAITLPERRFLNPLAKAVVEQRRILALDANRADRVVDMLDAVTLRGDEFIANPTDYLALKAVRTRIATAPDDETLRSAVDFMWEIALGIEDGDLSLAERRLRDARERLAEALENGASGEEIDKLMQELREAMQEYMQALAEQMKNMPPMSQEEMQSQNFQEIRPQDLQKMLDRIEDLAKSGSKDAAQQLLSELQQMMDNLQAMRPGQQRQGQGQQNPMQEQMNKLGEMLQRQQQLRDQTYDLGRQMYRQQQQQGRQGQQQQGQQQQGEQQQGENQEGQQGQQGQQPGGEMTAEQMQEMMKQLQQQQGELQQQLEAMRQELEGMGMQPSEDFGEAGEEMGNAEGSLGEGRDGEAFGHQGKALEALRRGAQSMMQQMQQAMQQGQQPGQGQMGQGFGGRQMNQSSRDPLGRQRNSQGPDFGEDVGIPDEIDTQRARRILDQIRKRLGNQLSPQQEREYLERLLQTP